MPTLAIIHTTSATVEPFKTLAAEILPGCEIINFVDDSILRQLARNGGDVAEVENRLVYYARFAQDAGADILLEACSSVGEVVPRMAAAVTIPVVRIDESMAEEAVWRGERLGVAATMSTTLVPTVRLLQSKAAAAGKAVTIQTALAEEAFRRLATGDRDGHDAILLDALRDLARTVDVVVLAQASMARVVARLPEAEQARCLTSPRSGMARVKALLDQPRGTKEVFTR